MVKKEYQAMAEKRDKTAKAVMKNQRASLKYSLEIVREIKGKRLGKASRFLKNVLAHKEYLPLKRHMKKVGHRKGDAKSGVKSGRYPTGTVNVWLMLLDSVKANADYRGLEVKDLVIAHAFASQGYKRMGYQSQGRISGKRRAKKAVHIEVVVREGK